MVFHPLHCVISSKIVNLVAEDLIEIATIAAEKEKFRNAFMLERLKSSNESATITALEVESVARTLANKSVHPATLSKSIKKISKKLSQHYSQLITIFERKE